MACPTDTMAFWPANLWAVPLDQFQVGVIPIIWTTGALPNPAGGDPDPWLGRRVPDRLEWYGNSVELFYAGGWYERGLCYTAVPSIRVLIQGFCTCGVNNLTIQVKAGNRTFFDHLIALNGNDGMFEGRPLFVDQCQRKYANPATAYRISIKLIVRWLLLCADYTLQGVGTRGLWWEAAADFLAGETLIFRPCEGCEYGFLETSKGRSSQSWDSLQLAAFPVRSFPLKRNEGMVKVNFGNGATKVLVVDTNTGDADKYAKAPLTCDDTQSHFRSELFISDECFLPEEDSLPEDQDPRWRPQPSQTCVAEYASGWNNSGLGNNRPYYAPGTYDGYRTPVSLASTTVQDVYFDPYVGSNGQYYQGRGVHHNRAYYRINHYTKYVPSTQYPGFVDTIQWTTVEEFYMDISYRFADSAGYIAKIEAFGEAARLLRAAGTCDAPFQFDNGTDFSRRPPPIIKKKEERLNLDGECYIQGVVTIGIKFNVEFTRIFKQLGPEVQEWAIRKILPKFVPAAIRIPFKFQLPQGQAPYFGTTLNLTGTFLQIGVGPESIIVNMEEVFSYYNLADDLGIVSALIPGPVGLSDLSSFCVP